MRQLLRFIAAVFGGGGEFKKKTSFLLSPLGKVCIRKEMSLRKRSGVLQPQQASGNEKRDAWEI